MRGEMINNHVLLPI